MADTPPPRASRGSHPRGFPRGPYRARGGDRHGPNPRLAREDTFVRPSSPFQHHTNPTDSPSRQTQTSSTPAASGGNNYTYARRQRAKEKTLSKAERDRKKAIAEWPESDGPPPVWLTGERPPEPEALYTMYAKREPESWDDTPLAERFRRVSAWVMSTAEVKGLTTEELEALRSEPVPEEPPVKVDDGPAQTAAPTGTAPAPTGIRGVLPAIPGAIKPTQPNLMDEDSDIKWGDPTPVSPNGQEQPDVEVRQAITGWAKDYTREEGGNQWETTPVRGRGSRSRGRGHRGRGTGSGRGGRGRGGRGGGGVEKETSRNAEPERSRAKKVEIQALINTW